MGQRILLRQEARRDPGASVCASHQVFCLSSSVGMVGRVGAVSVPSAMPSGVMNVTSHALQTLGPQDEVLKGEYCYVP